MKLKTLAMAVAISPAFLSGLAAADDGVFRARAGVSTNSFDTIWSGGNMKTDYTSLNLGLTYLTQNSFYFDIATKSDLGANWNTSELLPVDDDDAYSRTDITLTAGKVLESGIQIFAGYQKSDATIDLPLEAQQALGWNKDETVTITGFFAGVGKSFKVGDGSLNLNASYGMMDAEVIASLGDKFTSDSGNGYSLGASYTYYLNDTTSLSVELKNQKYSYDYAPSDIILLTAGDDKMTMFGININKQF